MTFDKGIATLVAAGIAALSSLIVLASNRNAEIRTARRNSLEKYVAGLSSSIHQLIATSNILLKAKTTESQANWKDKAQIAKDQLKAMRPELSYSLWGIDSSLQTLSRLPDFTSYTLSDKDVAAQVVKTGTKLGGVINRCIKNCYLKGRAPNWLEIKIINYYEWRFRRVRDSFTKKKSSNKRDTP